MADSDIPGRACPAEAIMCPDCPERHPRAAHCGELCEVIAELIAEPVGHEAWHAADRRQRSREASRG